MLNGATSGIILKNAGATVWIPSEDEWYKGAYYDPTKDGSGGYWQIGNGTDYPAGNTVGVAGSANYAFAGAGTGSVLTEVGAYGANSESYYGLNDMAGNLWEWNDAVIDSSERGLRGGFWGGDWDNLVSGVRWSHPPTSQDDGMGFRVASIPEPSSVLLSALFGLMCVTRRKR